MWSTSQYMPSHLKFGRRLRLRLLSFSLTLVILYAGIIASSHFHKDFKDHSANCAICALVFHVPTVTSASFALTVLWGALAVLLVQPVLRLLAENPALQPPSRASPDLI